MKLEFIYLKKYWIIFGQQEMEIIVDKLFVKVGIDLYNKLIDCILDDNLILVEEE